MLKKLNLLPLLLLLLCSNIIYAQQNAIAINSFTVKHDLPPNIDEWRSTPAAASMVVENKTWGDRQLRLVIMLKQGDKNICGSDGIDLDYFKNRSFQTKDFLQGLKNCEALNPGKYTLCVRFRGMSDNRQWVDVSPEVCKPFTVDGGSTDNQKYKGPSIISPANNKVFTEQEANGPIVLRCTPVVPKPQEPVIYHFSIWKVEKGETPVHAMTGLPVVEKSVENLTQTTITSGLFPCTNCQYVCKVQATNKEGKPYGENNGVSEPSYFRIPIIGTGDVVLICNSCESIQWNAGNATQTIQGNNINIIQSFSPTGYVTITSAKAEITAFERYVGDSCMNCNKDWNQWGNFISGTYAGIAGALGIAVAPVTGGTHHSMYWSSSSTGSFNLNISTPVLSNLNCCCDRVVVTIRYTYTFKKENNICITCSQVKTYEVKKGNCPNRPISEPDGIIDPS